MSSGNIKGKMAMAATAFACMTLVSVGWSGSAQAQTSHPKSSMHQASRHVAAGPHRHWRHAYGYGANPVGVGADLAAGAIGTAGAVAADAIGTAGAIAGAPFGAGPYAGPGGYYASSGWGDYDCRLPHAYDCRPYASKDWGYH